MVVDPKEIVAIETMMLTINAVFTEPSGDVVIEYI
jgi:hypothetical protein